MATSSKKKKKTVAKQPDQIVYVGPNMGGVLPMTQFSVYRGGLPKLVQARVDSDPEFARLFVPVGELDAARAEVKVRTSVKGRAFIAALKYRTKGGK